MSSVEAPTEKQVEWLNKKGLTIPATKKEASELLKGVFGDSKKQSTGNSGGYSKPSTKVEITAGEKTPSTDTLEYLEQAFSDAEVFVKKHWPTLERGTPGYGPVFGMVFNQACNKQNNS